MDKMETHKNFEKRLQESMSLDAFDKPSQDLVKDARKKIALRKKQKKEPFDLFSLLAAFLNFKVKLYQAIVTSLVVGGLILIFNRPNNDFTNEAPSDYMTNIVSVQSSTVLSSIYTFGLNKKPYDGQSTN
jgi:hypothetical protein